MPSKNRINIMSGDKSRSLWKDINSIPQGKAREAVYHLGCKCQELESLLDKAFDRISLLEASVKKEKDAEEDSSNIVQPS